MRKLMWFAIGFALACGLCAYWLPESWYLPAILITFAVALVGVPVSAVRRISLCGLGLAMGLSWCSEYRNTYLQMPMLMDGETVTVTITATDYSYQTNYGAAFDGTLELGQGKYAIRTYLNGDVTLEPGDTVTGNFRMRYTPGGEESATYHPGKGIFLLGYQKSEITQSAGDGEWFYPAVLAKKIKDTLQELFPEDVFPFTQALLLGDSTELDYETETAFKISGIRHIIAVSGLHVTILYSLLSAITFRKRFLTAIICLPTLALFAAVAGFTPSVTRACIMIALMILARICNKDYDTPTALAFAVMIMLMVNPMAITSVSLQLSAGCVAGIQLVGNRVQQWLDSKMGGTKGKGIVPGLKRWVTSSVGITIGAMSLTTPLCAYYFGAVSLIGILTNLLVLWLVTLIFNGLVAVCVLSLMWLEAAGALADILAWPIRFVLGTAKLMASFPLAAVYTKSVYIVIWLIFIYALISIFLILPKRKPGVMLTCAAFGLCVALLVSWVEPLLDDVRVTVLDVGQGQSILLQSKGNTYLVDCGGEDDEETADLIAETLLSQGISRLDGIILTHCDADHAGGLPYLLTRIKTNTVFYPATDTLVLEEGNLYSVSQDLLLQFNGGEIRIFGPIYVSDSNENSLCVLFTAGNCDILITGDRGDVGEMMLLDAAEIPKVEVLIAGHHGSKYSTTEALLNAVQPEYIFVSAGADNSYGHPAPEMLNRAEDHGCVVYRTDLHGTLTFRR